jgi:hypothetical protein
MVHQFKNPETLRGKEVFLHILPGKGQNCFGLPLWYFLENFIFQVSPLEACLS